jgi:hypothetical protein
MASQNHPRYAEFRAALERLLVAQDRVAEALASEEEAAQAEQAAALAAYQKISQELTAEISEELTAAVVGGRQPIPSRPAIRHPCQPVARTDGLLPRDRLPC